MRKTERTSGDVVGDKLKGRFHLRLDVVDNLPPSYMSVVDAEGENGRS